MVSDLMPVSDRCGFMSDSVCVGVREEEAGREEAI